MLPLPLPLFGTVSQTLRCRFKEPKRYPPLCSLLQTSRATSCALWMLLQDARAVRAFANTTSGSSSGNVYPSDADLSRASLVRVDTKSPCHRRWYWTGPGGMAGHTEAAYHRVVRLILAINLLCSDVGNYSALLEQCSHS